jgi:hypothetical protein
MGGDERNNISKEIAGFETCLWVVVSCPINSVAFVAIKMGLGKAVRAGLAVEGAYLNR